MFGYRCLRIGLLNFIGWSSSQYSIGRQAMPAVKFNGSWLQAELGNNGERAPIYPIGQGLHKRKWLYRSSGVQWELEGGVGICRQESHGQRGSISATGMQGLYWTLAGFSLQAQLCLASRPETWP